MITYDFLDPTDLLEKGFEPSEDTETSPKLDVAERTQLPHSRFTDY